MTTSPKHPRNDRMLTVDQLRQKITDGQIDTVVLAFTDMQGRLQGKLNHAQFFLDAMLTEGAEGCNYLLAVDKQMEADHNHIVVAVVDGECTVKRLVCEHGTWWLKPENPDYQPWEIHDAGAVRIWGVVTHVLHELIPGKLAALLRTRD